MTMVALLRYVTLFQSNPDGVWTDLGLSFDSKSADKELKAVTPEKNKACVTAFFKKVGNNLPVTINQK